MDLGTSFDNYGSLHASVPGQLYPLSIDVELGQECLGIDLVLDGQKVSLEVLGEGQLLVAYSLAWWISSSSAA